MTGSANTIRVLLADDEPHLGAILEQFLVARGFTVTAVRNGRLALEALQAAPYDVALLDVVMPEMDGLEVLRRVREESTPPEILIITGNGTVETTLAALKLGAYDVLSKPYRMTEIEALIRRAFEKRLLVRDNARLRARVNAPVAAPSFVTQYAPLKAMLSTLEPVKATRSPVLLWGESGTGKRAFAHWLHGSDAGRPFIEWSGAAVADDADAMAQLFGVEGGVAHPHDADANGESRPTHIGVLEMAAHGTLLLRALARLSHDVQRAVATAVRRGWFTRVGGTQPIPLECRVINALMRDPDVLVAEGALDADVVRTLSVVRVGLPPLRERHVDVMLLATQFAARSVPPRTLDADAAALLEQRPWRHNVRELETLIAAAATHAAVQGDTAGRINVTDIHAADAGVPSPRELVAAHETPAPRAGLPAGLSLDALERAYIEFTLQSVGWHQGRAAVALGISPKTLYRKIREYGFTRPSGRSIR